MGLTEEVRQAFRASVEVAQASIVEAANSEAASKQRVAAQFKPIADVIRAIQAEAQHNFPKVRFSFSDFGAYISGNGNELSFNCYEIFNRPGEYTGECKYSIYLDLTENSYFSKHFDADEVEQVAYLAVKIIADYCMHGTIPQNTFYYQMSKLGYTDRNNEYALLGTQDRVLELMSEEEKRIFAGYIATFWYPESDTDFDLEDVDN